MLGVLKRRWKPSKRASSGRGTEASLSPDPGLEKPRPVPSPRQIHPLYGEKAGLLGYYDAVGNTENFPPAPNIVVEGGRIEFVRPSQDVTSANANTPNATSLRRNNTVSRASQTSVESSEKSDPAKESLEERVEELEKILVDERAAAQRDRATIAKLQRQVNKREATQRDVERERRLRMEAEGRVREATADAERARTRVHHLQRELARIEESSRGLLQHKQRADQLKQERAALALSYESRVHQCQSQISKLQSENESMRGQLRGLEAACAGEVHAALVDRLATLETEHVALARDADAQRRQYERCLDDVANQVVRALLSQKGLREEIGGLQRRIRELETQNRALSGLLAQAANPGSPTELLQGIIEAGPGALVAALGLDPSSWLPLSRPRSLNLKIPVMATTKSRRNRPIGQKPSEEEGSESPESVNRDEGYSTMSSDVQCEGARQEPSSRGLEDLKEATDETEAEISSPEARHLVTLGNPENPADVLFLPLNLTVGINPRHSYPPNKDLLPFHHVMRSFSDSHLYLKLTTATANLAPSSYNVASPGATSSSIMLLDEDGWDAEYVQQWLRLDESRSAQQNRDLLELEYDRAELEDWSFSLSSEDIRGEACLVNNGCYTSQIPTTGSYPVSIKESQRQRQRHRHHHHHHHHHHPPHHQHQQQQQQQQQQQHQQQQRQRQRPQQQQQQHQQQQQQQQHQQQQQQQQQQQHQQKHQQHQHNINPIELEEDANECLWNGASYLADRAGGELVALLMDARTTGPWPYASSPGASWSSEEGALENSSKRSSAALSGCSDDPDSPSVGTDFTRDFYRLVKFESTKSLASTSSRGGKKPSVAQDREQALQSVLSFIAEQQMYIAAELPQNCLTERDSLLEDNVGDSKSDVGETATSVERVADVENERESSEDRTSGGDVGGDGSGSEDHLESLTTSLRATTILVDDRSIDPTNRNASPIGLNYASGSGVPSELVAVPEEDEEAATSSATPSTVVSPARAPPLLPVEDDPDRTSLSFHEHATSKDVINELNRMIRKGEDNPSSHRDSPRVVLDKLDLACCCPTGWVHVERDIDFTDPKARANLLDVMLASSESSSATSSSGSAGSDSGDEPPDYRHLHRLHRYRRQKKATAAHGHRVLRIPSALGSSRPSIIGRGDDFFVRYGDKEREAVASFDFLDDLNVHEQISGSPPTPSLPSPSSSIDDLLARTFSKEFVKVSPM